MQCEFNYSTQEGLVTSLKVMETSHFSLFNMCHFSVTCLCPCLILMTQQLYTHTCLCTKELGTTILEKKIQVKCVHVDRTEPAVNTHL